MGVSYDDGKPGFAGPPYCACGQFWPTPEHEAGCEEQNERLREFGSAAARLMGVADEGEAARWLAAHAAAAAPLTARMPEWAVDESGPPTFLTTIRDETAADVLRRFDEIRATHGRPATSDEANRIAEEAAARHWMSALDRYLPPAGARCQVCGEPNCEREECSLEPCPWCGADAYAGGAGGWVDCSGPCGAIGPGHQTMPEAAAAWNALARNHREAPGLRERVDELEAERDALLERLARRDDEIRRLEARR